MKLTLNVDDEVIQKAKQWAAKEGTSVSRLVEGFLRDVTEPEEGRATPVLRRLRGCLRGGDPQAHRRHLAMKYQ